jgi:streptomycin 6-kinase
MSDGVHPGLAWHAEYPAGSEWLERLPGLVREAAARWSLTPGRPYEYAFASLALPATTAGGDDVVLKVQFPDTESEHEAAALRRWDGDGAVRLLDYDPGRRALLLERCIPGTSLAQREPEEALDVIVGLLPRLWVPAGEPFRTLAEEATGWLAQMQVDRERLTAPFEHELVDVAVDALHELPSTQGEQVLLHQDLHADNVLAAQREPWLVIDPKPLVGEREFGVAAIVRGSELGHSREAVRRRLHRVCSELGLDEERARRWTIAQTLAWGFDDEGGVPPHIVPKHAQIASWLL